MFVAFTKYALFAKFYIEKTFFTKKKPCGDKYI